MSHIQHEHVTLRLSILWPGKQLKGIKTDMNKQITVEIMLIQLLQAFT